ncbi:MAG: hypothetical protein E7F83_03275 [Clostridium sp.]|uniref:Uncharacterized protein n=1 Tax=Clostridium tertium TaxID=1559 RepID=A0A6N3FQW3_9CLOT|nr:hypothetical protein [Clostridium sp.]MDU3546425.1 hypothetical protein [Clostridium sp.]
MIKRLLEKIPFENENRALFKKEIQIIINYFKDNNYNCYIKEILYNTYLSISKNKKVCYIRLKWDNKYLTKYEFIIFRYSFNSKKIEAFRTKEVTIINGDEDLDFVIKEIENKLQEDNQFDLISENYKSKDIAKNSLLEEYNKLLKENGFKTKIVKEKILRNVNEILFFTKYRENAIEPNVIFALWISENSKNNITVSSIAYMNGKLDVGDFYSYETMEKVSIDKLEMLII